MNIHLSLTNFKKLFLSFLHRFHVMIFVTVVIGGVIIFILLLNNIITRSGESGDYVAPNASSASFDQKTIDKIKKLQASGQSGDPKLPGGRTNPFVE